MRDRKALRPLLTVLLALEGTALLAPAAVVAILGGKVALAGVLPPWSDNDFGPLAWRWLLLGLFLLPSAFGTLAILEVARVLLATVHGRYLGWSRRTTWAALSGVLAVAAGAIGISVVGNNQPPPLLMSLAVLAGPIALFCFHLGWLQFRLGRTALAP